jgi:hypothetical protein
VGRLLPLRAWTLTRIAASHEQEIDLNQTRFVRGSLLAVLAGLLALLASGLAGEDKAPGPPTDKGSC